MKKLLLTATLALLPSWALAQANPTNVALVLETCDDATIFLTGRAAPLTVNPEGVLCVTGSGGGGGTSSNFGEAFPSAGTAAGFEDASGDMAPVVLEADGSLPVTIVAGAGSGGTASTDDSAFSAGVGSGTPTMGFVTTDDVDAGDVGVVGMTDDRALWINIRNDAGSEVTSWPVTNAGTFAVQAAQSGTWNITDISGTISLPTGAATAANQQTDALTDTELRATPVPISGTVTVTDGAGALNVIVDSGTLTAVTTITNPVTVTDGAGALNVIVDSGSITANAGTNLNTSALALEATLQDVLTDTGNIDTDTGVIAAGYAAEGSALGSGVLLQGDDGTDRTNVAVDTSGNVQVDCVSGCAGSGGTSSAYGDPFPADGTAAGFTDGTNMVAATVLATQADNLANTVDGLQVTSLSYIFDGSTWDRWTGAVTGTVTANAGTDLNTSALALEATLGGVLTSTNFAAAFGTAGSADSQVMSIQGIASMTPVTVSDGSGAMNVIVDSGTLTAVTAITNALPAGTNNIGDVDVLSFPDNEPFNVAQINGVTPLMGAGNTGTGSPRVTIATDQAALTGLGVTATGAAVSANAQLQGYRCDGGLAAGTAANCAPVICQNSIVIDGASSGNTELVALTSSETIYVCGYSVIAAGTVEFQLIYGTGTACATGETNLTGNYNLTAQAGIVDRSPFAQMSTAVSNALCYELSGAVAVDGVVYYTKF